MKNFPSHSALALFLLFNSLAGAQTAATPSPSVPPSGETFTLDPVLVTSQLDQARAVIAPSLGATSFRIDQQQILNQPLGADAPFNQVLLRAPGVAADSAANGDLHVRGEHANLQYRIDDVLLPEGIWRSPFTTCPTTCCA